MAHKKDILFIINPHSGNKKAQSIVEMLPKYLDATKFSWKCKFTEYANHATEIAKSAVDDHMDIVVAVGGDGMVNEVFQSLVNTKTAFSIIPKGSGNGIARSFGIPMNTIKAIENLNTGTSSLVDTCLFNNKPFLGIAGIGFDGTISALFANKMKRGFKTYLKLIISKIIKYSPSLYKLTIDGKVYEYEAFIIAFANTNQYGNNAIIAPSAKFNDGKIDLVVIKSFPKWLSPLMAFKLMTNSIQQSNYVKSYQTPFIEVVTNMSDAHIDGEPITAYQKNLISIIPKSLEVFR